MFEVNPKKLNPLGYHLLNLMQDSSIRFIILYGGSSSGKSYSVAQMVLIMTMADKCNTLVMRKVGASISKAIYEDFKVAAKQLGIFGQFRFKDGVKQALCLTNSAKIDFGGLDDPEKIKGISNYKRVVMDEWSEFDSEDFKQVRKRLRGKVGQQIITTFNPIKETHWIKKEIFDKEQWVDIPMDINLDGQKIPSRLTEVKSIKRNSAKDILNPRTRQIETHAPDTIVIQTTYLNNFWVIGSPDGTYGYYDEQCIADFEKDRVNDPDYYNVYALGEWGVIRTGSEFFGSFNRGAHVADAPYNPSLPVHISVDSNVLPYITCTYWQMDTTNGNHIVQIGETLAESPNNTVRKSAKLVAKRLHELNPEKVYLHGDASTRAANNIDDEKRSFLDLFIDTLSKEGIEVEDKVGNKNPSVAMSGEFINAIFDGIVPGLKITIGENCPTSIEDYLAIQKDANGAILKTKVKNKITMQTYEEHGHCCFAPEVPVCTDRGDVPICEVRIGDRVLTEKGWQTVYNSMLSIRKSQIFFVSLQGKKMRCTYDHPVFTERGFVPMYQLKTNDVITLQEQGRTWKERLQHSTAINFIVTLTANVRAIGHIIADGLGLMASGPRHLSTGICGLSPMEQYPKAIVFIMLMVTTTIIHLITLLLYLPVSMLNTTPRCLLKKGLPRTKKPLMPTEARPQSGTAVRKESNGTRRIARLCGRVKAFALSPVKCVAKTLSRIANKLQSFVATTAKANGDDFKGWTMKNALVKCVGLNLLSTSTLRRSVVHGNVLLRLERPSDVYDISTTSHTFFANGVLVHNSDTFRYVVADLLREEFLLFSNRRKRNLYARDGVIHFYNPNTNCTYSRDIVYAMPSVNGMFALVHGKMCGNKWHITHLQLKETASTDEMRDILIAQEGEQTVLECAPAYFRFVRDLRKDISNVRAMQEVSDLPRRISATSDFVKNHLLFNEERLNDDAEYAQFMTCLLDYNKQSGENYEASAVLSGFIQFVVKFSLEGNNPTTSNNTTS